MKRTLFALVFTTALNILNSTVFADTQAKTDPKSPQTLQQQKCPKSPDGEDQAYDEEVQIPKKDAANPSPKPITKSTCVPTKELKDSKGRACKTGRLTCISPEGKRVMICDEQVRQYGNVFDANGNCSFDKLSTLSKLGNEIRVPLSPETKDDLRKAFKAGEIASEQETGFGVFPPDTNTTLSTLVRERARNAGENALSAEWSDAMYASAYDLPFTSPTLTDQNGEIRLERTDSKLDATFIMSNLHSCPSESEGGVCINPAVLTTRGELYFVPNPGNAPVRVDKDAPPLSDDAQQTFTSVSPAQYYALDPAMSPRIGQTPSIQPRSRDNIANGVLNSLGAFDMQESIIDLGRNSSGQKKIIVSWPDFSSDIAQSLTEPHKNYPNPTVSGFSNALVDMWQDIKKFPKEIFDSPLFTPKFVGVFGYNADAAGSAGYNNSIDLFTLPKGIWLPNTMGHELTHSALTHDLISNSWADTRVGGFITGQPIVMRDATPLSQQVPDITTTGLRSYGTGKDIGELLAVGIGEDLLQDPQKFHDRAQTNPYLAKLEGYYEAALHAFGVPSSDPAHKGFLQSRACWLFDKYAKNNPACGN